MKHILLVVVTMALAFTAAAQQKPSERPFAEEVKKIKEKQAERNRLLTQQNGTAPASTTQPPPVIPAQNNPSNVNDKPSSGPAKLPARIRRQK
jgi:hypothetical protein